MSKSDPYVTCPDCDGKGGGVSLRPARSSAASTPREVYCECHRCDGDGEIHVRDVRDDEWSDLG